MPNLIVNNEPSHSYAGLPSSCSWLLAVVTLYTVGRPGNKASYFKGTVISRWTEFNTHRSLAIHAKLMRLASFPGSCPRTRVWERGYHETWGGRKFDIAIIYVAIKSLTCGGEIPFHVIGRKYTEGTNSRPHTYSTCHQASPEQTCRYWLDTVRARVWERIDFESDLIPSWEALWRHWLRSFGLATCGVRQQKITRSVVQEDMVRAWDGSFGTAV